MEYRNRKWELLENSLHMLESNGWHSIVKMFIVFCSECLKQKLSSGRVTGGGYIFFTIVSTTISG
jgi:hypothetical protein